jgi:conjugal transfer pilin signal peptidase TrbI
MNAPARRRFLRRSLFWTAVAFVVASLAASAFRDKYRIGADFSSVRCLPWRVYLVTLGPVSDPVVGEYVAFVARRGLMGPNFEGRLIAKKVAGVPGDQLVVQQDFASVSGRPIGPLDSLPKLNAKPGAFDRTAIVPAGHVLLVGTEPRSYDGRYWGFLNQHDLVGRITPIF